MFILGVETATRVGSVAVVSEDGLIGEYTLNLSITHSERLLPSIDQLLKSIDIHFSNIDGLAVSLGPGSFTGLRIGISTIKGLSLASDKPVAGIPTLDALAQNYPGPENVICPMLDARKKEVFTAIYFRDQSKQLKKTTSYQAISPKELLKKFNVNEKVAFLGDGSHIYRPLIEEVLSSRAVFAPLHLSHPRAATVAFLGLEEIKRGNKIEVTKLSPIYVRPSEAELQGKMVELIDEVGKGKE